MPTFREKKTNRGAWDLNSMKNAVNLVMNGATIREASERYEVPKSTLGERVKAIKNGKEIVMEPHMGKFKRTFTDEQEAELVDYMVELDRRLMPLNKEEFLRKLLYAIAYLTRILLKI